MTNLLTSPLWVTLKENGDLIKMERAEQIKLLEAELELLRGYQPSINPPSTHNPYTATTETWQYGLVGLHNPRKHKGLSPKKYVETYLKKKAKTPYQKTAHQYIESHMSEAIEFCRNRFTRTLTG